ncbi:MAG: hypothetical protein BMS9Abin10_0057 [Gammaproteobacteria bacterium]|nr:MAG: hypothetical protein BMS9Abin10_0057 [Gammaproteobacteria bacterium]
MKSRKILPLTLTLIGLWPIVTAADASGLQLYASDLSGYTDAGAAPGTGPLGVPFSRPRLSFSGQDKRQQNLLALKWEHRLSQAQSFAFAAGYADEPYAEEKPYESESRTASFSWTSTLTGKMQPRLTGSLFIGDEDAKGQPYQYLDRRYYGVSLGGRLTLFEKHSPYLSLQMLRSDYDGDVTDDPFALLEYSRLIAGWDWQVRPNWRLRAEADYLANDLSLNPYRYDKSRIFFSTRFDFR